MASHPSEVTQLDKPISASRRREILDELVEIASNAANKQFDAFTTRLSEALLHASDTSADPQEAKRCADASALLKKNRYPFYYVACECTATVLDQEIQAARHPFAAHEDAGSALKTLPPDLEVDKKLCLIKASRVLENEHAERLTALNMRLACLLDQGELATAQNPFRPLVFLAAIHDAWCEFQPDTSAHHLVFRLLGPGLCLDMAPILHALNQALIRCGILPNLAQAPHFERVAPEQPALKQKESDGDAMTRQLRRMFPMMETVADKAPDRPIAGALPALFEDGVLHARSARDQVLSYLDSVQNKLSDRRPAAPQNGPQHTSMLTDLKRQAPQGIFTQADEHTIDLVAKVFDTVFLNKNIPAEIKELVGSLQVQVLKAAVIDKDFFFQDTHPARRLIESLTKAGIGWNREKGQADPLLQLIQRNVRRIQQQFDRQVSVFADAAADLESFIGKEEAIFTKGLSTSIVRAVQEEKRQHAAKASRHEVALRVGTGEVVAFVETFLEDKWVSVLTLAYGVKDEKPEAVANALQTMDDLCWSVKPKITVAERKDLIARLPSIVAALNKWLDLIKWNDTDREKFFDDLAKCHASIVRAPLELSPERQLQIAIAVARKAAERRLERQANQNPEPEPDEFAHMVGQLKPGAWLEFTRKDGAVLKIKLAWVSPMCSLYIFSAQDRQEALSVSADELALALREKRAKVMLLPGLVGRALAEALGIDSANQEMQGAQSAA